MKAKIFINNDNLKDRDLAENSQNISKNSLTRKNLFSAQVPVLEEFKLKTKFIF